MNLFVFGDRGFERGFARCFIQDLEPARRSEQRQRGGAGTQFKSVLTVECYDVPAYVADLSSGCVIEVHGQRKLMIFRLYLEHELFFPVYDQHAVCIPIDIRADV